MEIIGDFNDVCDAFRELLVGNRNTLSDATRLVARRQLRSELTDRVFKGRIPQSASLPAISLLVQGDEADYFLSGQRDCPTSFVELTIQAPEDRAKTVLANAVRRLLDGFSGSVITSDDSSWRLAAVWIESAGDFDPEEVLDGSDDWVFVHQIVFGVVHDQVIAQGVN